MKQPMRISREQLTLFQEPSTRLALEEETREALIMALADLLLEAYGAEEDMEAPEQEGRHEP